MTGTTCSVEGSMSHVGRHMCSLTIPTWLLCKPATAAASTARRTAAAADAVGDAGADLPLGCQAAGGLLLCKPEAAASCAAA